MLLFQGWPAQDWAHKLPCHYVSLPPLDILFQLWFPVFLFLGFGVSCCLFWPCWCVFVLFGRLLVLFLSWNGIINTCTTNQEPFTVSAPLAIINTASKHLHNDLARAIKALEQKKNTKPQRSALLYTVGQDRPGISLLPEKCEERGAFSRTNNTPSETTSHMQKIPTWPQTGWWTVVRLGAYNLPGASIFFFLVGALCLSAGHHLRLTRGPAGNRTTTGSLSAKSAAIPTELRGHLIYQEPSWMMTVLGSWEHARQQQTHGHISCWEAHSQSSTNWKSWMQGNWGLEKIR